jgi:ABC-2 type transport system ATP-binding protein
MLIKLPAERTPRVVWEAARDAGEQVRAFRPRRSTLEEVFLDALGEDR